MKILDRYIAKNFMVGYAISFLVLIGLRIIIDLFVNLDEFTEQKALTTADVIRNIITFYGINSTIYFRDFAGMITVVAAAFSLGKMVRQHELVVVMASGVSLKRVIGPIALISLILTGVLVVDQEVVIPHLAEELSRSQDDIAGQKAFYVWFMPDGQNSLICAGFDAQTSTLITPTIITREPAARPGVWNITGRIVADSAVYDEDRGKWKLVNGLYARKDSPIGALVVEEYDSGDLTPREIVIRRKADNTTLMSSRQLAQLAAQKTRVKDLAQLYSQKHFRITDPIINFTMLMVSLPILVCRDPRTMKSATMISFLLTTACFVTAFICKICATETLFDRIMPELWAWLPVIIFMPIAFIELDSMKT
ncbi:MAG TPA: YjgP/YjgQ family permease [Phycisphaerales bacterium]|nr:YjgP/YjgQ family permease [Phycisphaerales bacterium]